MDRRWSRNVQSRLYRSVKIYDQIVSTWWYISSIRWWSSKIWRPGRKVQGKVWWCFGMDIWSLDSFHGKRRRTPAWRVFPSNLGTFRRYSRWSNIGRQCTVAGRLRRVHLPHRERSRHALHHPGRIDSRRKKSQDGQAVSVFHSRESDVRHSRSGRSPTRSGQTQNCGVQKYVDNTPK